MCCVCTGTCTHVNLCGDDVPVCARSQTEDLAGKPESPRPRPQPLLPGALVEENIESPKPRDLGWWLLSDPALPLSTQIACGTKELGIWIIYTVNIKQLVVYLNSSLLGREIPGKTLRQ